MKRQRNRGNYRQYIVYLYAVKVLSRLQKIFELYGHLAKSQLDWYVY